MNAFYLVQRLESKTAPDVRQGFDGFFSLDYMGSSEFEWGAIPKALRSMREKRVVVESADVQLLDDLRTVYFVGHKGVASAAAAMESWAHGEPHGRKFFGKEWTYFDQILDGSASDYVHTNAWWDIENDVAWSLDPVVAAQLALAFNTPKAAS